MRMQNLENSTISEYIRYYTRNGQKHKTYFSIFLFFSYSALIPRLHAAERYMSRRDTSFSEGL